MKRNFVPFLLLFWPLRYLLHQLSQLKPAGAMLYPFLLVFLRAMVDTLVKLLVHLAPQKSIARSSSTRRAGLALIRRFLARPRLIMAKYMNFPAALTSNLAPPINW